MHPPAAIPPPAAARSPEHPAGPPATPAVGIWVTVVTMLALAALVYLPAALGARFLGFDDNFFFGPDNPEFQEGLAALLDPSRPIANAWLPVAHVSLWLDYRLFDGQPFGPHLMAILWHAAAAVLFVRLLLALRCSLLLAHLAGALFVLHPALAESVAWVSGRKDLVSGVGVLLTLLTIARGGRAPGCMRLSAVAVLTALSMYAKPTAVVLPLLAALVAWRSGGGRAYAGALVSLLVVLPIAWHHQAIAAAEGTLADGDLAQRFAQVPGAFRHYLTTGLWPTRLNVLYPEVETLERFRAGWLGGTIVLGLFLAAIAAAAPRWRNVALGLCWFVLALLPFNTAYPASAIAAADRYLYLALPGLVLAVAAAAERLIGAHAAWLFVLVVPLAWLAGGRAHDFRDDESLWTASLEVERDNAVAHLNLTYHRLAQPAAKVDDVRPHLTAAAALARYPVHAFRAHRLLTQLAMAEADYEAAAKHAERAIEAAEQQLARERAPARIAQARALVLQALLASFEPLQQTGDADGARSRLAAARELMPEHPDVIAFGALRRLAELRDELLAKAARGEAPRLPADDERGLSVDRELAAALERHPEHAGLWRAQAEWDRARDKVLPALRGYRRAQEADPRSAAAWLGAARLLREREKFEDALGYAQEGLRHSPDPALRQELALALVGLGRLDDAERQLEAYLRLRPDDQDAAKVLANVLVGRAYGKLADRSAHAEVRRLVERALTCNPKEAKAHLVLGRLAREERRFADAVRHLEFAHRVLPDFDDARVQYTESLAALGYDRLLQRDDDGAVEAWLKALAVAPPSFVATEIREQLRLAWGRIEARGVARLGRGERDAAIADFRLCLRIDPSQHWPAWLLATALAQGEPADFAAIEPLCRQAVAGQRQHGLDASEQLYLLATALVRQDRAAEAAELAADYLEKPSPEARPEVLAALRRYAAQ
jgi:protein O-mannosyl-transferase